jgi:hypothetical protein
MSTGRPPSSPCRRPTTRQRGTTHLAGALMPRGIAAHYAPSATATSEPSTGREKRAFQRRRSAGARKAVQGMVRYWCANATRRGESSPAQSVNLVVLPPDDDTSGICVDERLRWRFVAGACLPPCTAQATGARSKTVAFALSPLVSLARSRQSRGQCGFQGSDCRSVARSVTDRERASLLRVRNRVRTSDSAL